MNAARCAVPASFSQRKRHGVFNLALSEFVPPVYDRNMAYPHLLSQDICMCQRLINYSQELAKAAIAPFKIRACSWHDSKIQQLIYPLYLPGKAYCKIVRLKRGMTEKIQVRITSSALTMQMSIYIYWFLSPWTGQFNNIEILPEILATVTNSTRFNSGTALELAWPRGPDVVLIL